MTPIATSEEQQDPIDAIVLQSVDFRGLLMYFARNESGNDEDSKEQYRLMYKQLKQELQGNYPDLGRSGLASSLWGKTEVKQELENTVTEELIEQVPVSISSLRNNPEFLAWLTDYLNKNLSELSIGEDTANRLKNGPFASHIKEAIQEAAEAVDIEEESEEYYIQNA